MSELPPQESQEQIVDRVLDVLEKKYFAPGEKIRLSERVHIESWIVEVLSVFGGADAIKGKRILDLGCGHVPTPEQMALIETNKSDPTGQSHSEIKRQGVYDSVIGTQREFEPWFPRAIKELGADVVGVDIGNLEGEEFEHYQANFHNIGALNFLAAKSFDGIHTDLLTTSPQFSTTETLRAELRSQIERVLKDGGKKFGRDLEQNSDSPESLYRKD
ncbi:MAG: hypothetical protein AAB638_01300 [Patescibacteria group bacterium]